MRKIVGMGGRLGDWMLEREALRLDGPMMDAMVYEMR